MPVRSVRRNRVSADDAEHLSSGRPGIQQDGAGGRQPGVANRWVAETPLELTNVVVYAYEGGLALQGDRENRLALRDENLGKTGISAG